MREYVLFRIIHIWSLVEYLLVPNLLGMKSNYFFTLFTFEISWNIILVWKSLRHEKRLCIYEVCWYVLLLFWNVADLFPHYSHLKFCRISVWSKNLQDMKSNYVFRQFVDMLPHYSHLKFSRISFWSKNLQDVKSN